MAPAVKNTIVMLRMTPKSAGTTSTAVRRALTDFAELRSVAQLGSRLHLLISPRLADAESAVAARLREGGVEARVTRTEPSLEDIFVASTRKPPAPKEGK